MKITSRIVAHAQGTEAWRQHRATHLNASELAVVMGLSPYRTRAELVRIRATGIEPEVDAMTARRFAQGHEFEAIAREWAEDILQDTLYPTVLAADVDGLPLSASLDGQVLDGSVIFEHKSGNASLLASLEAGAIPEQYHPQLEQGLLLSGAERCLFMASSGDRDAMRFAWYTSRPALRAQIVPAWRQFLADVQSYTPTAAAEPAQAAPMESLPAVAVRLDGALTVAGNLPTFAQALRAFIDRMPARPTTDNDFATTDAACKALKRAEEALDAAEAGALASITDVEAMRRAVADCRKLARDTRLAAEKLVERRKLELKEQAVTAARAALDKHIATLNAELAPMRLQPVAADFAAAIKGLRSIASMQDALDTTLAAGKIAADAQARAMRANLAVFQHRAAGLESLFADLHILVHKAGDDFGAVLDARIAKHQADEAEKARKAAEQQARLIAEAEQRAREQEAARIADLQRQQAAAEAAAQAQAAAALAAAAEPAPAVKDSLTTASPVLQIGPPPAVPPWVATTVAPAADEPATLPCCDAAAPFVWVRPNGGNSIGVAHYGPTCPPGWAGAAEPAFRQAAIDAADLLVAARAVGIRQEQQIMDQEREIQRLRVEVQRYRDQARRSVNDVGFGA